MKKLIQMIREKLQGFLLEDIPSREDVRNLKYEFEVLEGDIDEMKREASDVESEASNAMEQARENERNIEDIFERVEETQEEAKTAQYKAEDVQEEMIEFKKIFLLGARVKKEKIEEVIKSMSVKIADLEEAKKNENAPTTDFLLGKEAAYRQTREQLIQLTIDNE